MKTSIEDIWQQGFMQKDALIAPQVNDLYNQKSKNIVDKLKTTFKWNLWGLLIGGVIVFIGLSAFSIPYLGGFICLVSWVLAYHGQQQLKTLDAIKSNISCFDYLTAFDRWLKGLITHYTRLYQWVYPMLFLASMIQVRYSELGAKAITGFIAEFPETPLLFSLPLILLVPILIFAGLLSYFAGPLYRLDMKTVYGRQFDKLEEILTDMKGLSNTENS